LDFAGWGKEWEVDLVGEGEALPEEERLMGKTRRKSRQSAVKEKLQTCNASRPIPPAVEAGSRWFQPDWFHLGPYLERVFERAEQLRHVGARVA